MIAASVDTLSRGLLAHLHLSAAEAAVMVEERKSECKLVVFIYDTAAARRTKHVERWRGLPVEYIEQSHSPYR